MTTLVVSELKTSITFNYNLIGEERYQVGSFIPYLYIHNSPSGSFTFNVSQDGRTIISKTFTSAEILSNMGTIDNYAHVFYPFSSSDLMIMGQGDFTATLEASGGYSYSNDSFIGWVRQYEDIQNIMNYTPSSDGENPLALRIKVYKEGISCA